MILIAKPRWHKDFMAVCNCAITEAVTSPSYKIKLAINGLLYKHARSGLWADREIYYNFRHDGAEGFGFYNYARPTAAKITKVGTVTHVVNSYVQFNNISGYYNTNRALGVDGVYSRLHNSNHWSCLNQVPYIWGVNTSGSGYTMFDNNVAGSGAIRLHCASADGMHPNSNPWPASGHFMVGRLNATQIRAVKNGVPDGNPLASNDNGFSLAAHSLYLGVRNSNGTAAGTGNGQLKYYSNGDITTETMDLAFYNAEVQYEADLLVLP